MKEITYKFEQHKGDPSVFFEMLPEDWQKAIHPIWKIYSANADIYVLLKEDMIIAGGIVFKEYTDDMAYFKKEAISLLNSGALYIGYLYVVETERGKDVGSLWLKSIKNHFRYRKLWLTIEDTGLLKFYIKNDFKIYRQFSEGEFSEILLILI